MQERTADLARDVILDHVQEQLAAKGLTPSDVPAAYDLLLEGVIDSFGVVELILLLERHFDIEFDFDELDPDEITRVGALADYVERKAQP